MIKYEVDNIVTGTVTGIEKYGIFINLENLYTGLVHISEISSGFVRNINDFVKIGEVIKVKVLEVNDEECHLKLSIKDIDYKLQKRNRVKIVETETGFFPLKNQLKAWTDQKIKEIS